jgi:hypothetical protein
MSHFPWGHPLWGVPNVLLSQHTDVLLIPGRTLPGLPATLSGTDRLQTPSITAWVLAPVTMQVALMLTGAGERFE